jgi:glycosyltransferase involved in cell wall biosynthesis
MTDRIDVVIPARNAAETIGDVVEAFAEHPVIGRIIVVINPPNVSTALALKALHYTNHIYAIQMYADGKGQAVKRGLEYVVTPHVIFCDADITGFTSDHVSALIGGAMTGEDSMVVGVPDIPDNLPEKRLWSFPWVSGQRCVPTRLVRPLNLHGYLMETQINCANGHAGWPVHFEPLYGCKSPFRMTEERIAAMMEDARWGKERGILP